jgi:hypothetical protein
MGKGKCKLYASQRGNLCNLVYTNFVYDSSSHYLELFVFFSFFLKHIHFCALQLEKQKIIHNDNNDALNLDRA